MINEAALRDYVKREFPHVTAVDIRRLGSGVHGSGFLISMKTDGEAKSYVIKDLDPVGLEHDYPSDRAGVFMLALNEYKTLPKHVKAVDVLAVREDGSIKSIGGGKDFFLLMERVEGMDYFHDLSAFAEKEHLDTSDAAKIKAMASYLAGIHAVKKQSRPLYWRKIRDTIGHGECLMGVFDTYPDGFVSYEEMAAIEKMCIDWRVRLKPMTHRLAQIHGDFHPGNIWFREDGDFVLLDRSRGPWGDPADDVTALAINYIFFSVRLNNDLRGAYAEGFRLFLDEYIKASGDKEMFKVMAPFFAFRGAVVANPLFYPDLSPEARGRIFNFMRNVLSDKSFEPERVNEYLG